MNILYTSQHLPNYTLFFLSGTSTLTIEHLSVPKACISLLSSFPNIYTEHTLYLAPFTVRYFFLHDSSTLIIENLIVCPSSLSFSSISLSRHLLIKLNFILNTSQPLPYDTFSFLPDSNTLIIEHCLSQPSGMTYLTQKESNTMQTIFLPFLFRRTIKKGRRKGFT